MKDIRYWVCKVLTPEQTDVEKTLRGEEARTEALRHGEDEVSARTEQQSAGAEKTEYGTVRHLPFSL